MVSGSLALLYGFFLKFSSQLFQWKQGSGPGRGQSPVEWGDFPSIRLSVRLSILLSIGPLVRHGHRVEKWANKRFRYFLCIFKCGGWVGV